METSFHLRKLAFLMQTQKQFCWGKVSMYYVFQNIVSAPKRRWGGAEVLRDRLSGRRDANTSQQAGGEAENPSFTK